MIPIENTLGGRVADMHHLLPESSLYIVNEHFQSVQHCLLAPAGAAPAARDFYIQGRDEHGVPGLVNLYGIESPGLTSAIAIGEHVAASI